MTNTCASLHHLFGGQERFSFPYEPKRIPKNGIYILFEAGERGHNTDRIVRVGTHTGHDQLRPRLKQHFIRENKDHSIFRKNIGRALLNQAGDPFLEQWDWNSRTRKEMEAQSHPVDLTKQKEVERQVTAYI